MNTRRDLIQICLLLVLSCMAWPFKLQAQLALITNNGSITISGYVGNPTHLYIPSTTNGYTVSSIANSAFQNKSTLVSVTIPDTVTNIGNSSFANCLQLTNASIGSGVLNLGSYAFASTSVTNLALPNQLVQIGDYAFSDCSGLASIIIPNSVTSIGTYAFDSCDHATNLVIGSGVTNIADYAFNSCPMLESISVNPPNTTYTNADGVLYSKGETGVVFCLQGKTGIYQVPSSVVNIGTSAFAFTRLTSVMLPDTVTNIGAWAFNTCGSLTNITLGKGLSSIGTGAFYMCQDLAEITMPNRVTTLGPDAFYSCTSLSGLFFTGNAPTHIDATALIYDYDTTVYFLPGTTNWTTRLANRPTMLWNPETQTADGNFGVRSNQFGFDIIGTTNIPIVVEASVNLSGGPWIPLQSVSLTNGSFYFSDPQWINYPSRFYRISFP